MSDIPISKMTDKQLRNAVQSLYDEFAVFKRKYQDAIYNLDSSNFGKSFTVEQNNMKTQLKITAEGLESTVSKTELGTELVKYSTIAQTADAITTMVNAEYVSTLIGDTYVTNAMMTSQLQQTSNQILISVSNAYETKENATSSYNSLNSSYNSLNSSLATDYLTKAQVESKISAGADKVLIEVSGTYQTTEAANNNYEYLDGQISDANTEVSNLKSSIEVNEREISALVSGAYTGTMLNNYLTGIVISTRDIKMLNGNAYSVYNSNGLRFYAADDQVEGWAIEPDDTYGGALKYYVNNSACYSISTGVQGDGYADTDMVIRALNSQRGRFVVDVTDSSYNEVKFVGVAETTDGEPYIYANEELLATQKWVLSKVGSGGSGGASGPVYAVFG